MQHEQQETDNRNSFHHTGRFLRPAFRFPRPASRVLRPMLCLCLLLVGIMAARPAAADTTDGADTHAGVVIQFDDGTLGEYCIDLGADGSATGEELLRATGVDVIMDYQGMGAAVCKIEGDGCDFPAQSCFCECSMLPGDPCTYWAYHRLQGGTWVQSNIGASSTTITGGKVDGWSWGTGTLSAGTAPPVRTFEQVCAAILVTATPTFAPPTPTATPDPTHTATATPRPSATATIPATATPAPTGTLIPVATEAVPTMTAVPPGATVAATNSSLPTVTRVPPTGTAVPPSPAIPAEAATATSEVATALPTATVPATVTRPLSPAGEGGTVTPAPSQEEEPAALPTLAAPVVNAPTPTVVIGIAVQPTMLPAGATANPPLVASDADEAGGDMWIYALFGVIVVGLAGVIGWMWYQQRVH